jgi:hypothetical protein
VPRRTPEGEPSGSAPPNPALNLSIDPTALKPIIAATVRATLEAVEQDQQKVGDRLAYSEQEAARLLGLQVHQLRDERLRGRIKASQVVGRRIRYTRQDLLDYLATNRLNEH